MIGNKYKEEIARLEKELAESRREMSDLRAEKEFIEEQRNGLVHERDELKEQREQGEKKRQYIEEQRNALVHERDELKNRTLELQKQTEEMSEDAKKSLNLAIENAKQNQEKLQKEKREIYSDYVRVTEEYNRMTYNASTLDKLHEDVVLRRWNNDTHLQKFTCTMPFEFLDIFSEGDAYCCCCDFVKAGYSLGNIYEKSFEELWNCENIQKLRYCVSMGDFEYCNSICSTLHSKPEDEINMVGLPPLQYRKDYNYNYKKYTECKLDHGPKYIKLECDKTCNLSCPSCRSSVKGLNEEESERVYNMLMEKVYPNLQDCEYLIGNNAGELLASKALIKFYQLLSHEKFPKMQLMIYSNGMLLDKEHVDQLSNLKGMPIIYSVSVDAAEKETYEKLRRGGKWEKLDANLLYIKSLLSEDKNIQLRLNFCVQKDNYKQIPQFMKLAKKWGASIVALQLMTDWGTMPVEEFKEKNVIHESNPHRQEALKLVKEAVDESEITVVTNIL